MTPAPCQLLLGDCLAHLATFEAGRFAAVVADPPYSSGGRTHGQRARSTSRKYRRSDAATMRSDFAGDSRDGRSWASWTAIWLGECLRVAEPGAYCLLFADWRQLPAATDALQWGGWTWRGIVPWNKGESARAPHSGYFRHQAEFVVWGSKGGLARRDGAGPWPGCYRHTVKHKRDKFHEAGKPSPLMDDLLACVRPGGEVLDPFAGSATTLLAARRRGLSATGIEVDPVIFQIADRRLFGPRGLVA